MSSIFGQLFRVSTWGESHGGGVGVVVDGCPPRVPLTVGDIQRDLDRRRPGQSKIVTPRNEADRCEILSGVFQEKTLGTPIAIMVRNQDARPEAYAEMATKYRPSHADFTYQAKYGIRDWHGGGRASARETIGRVAAAAVAKQFFRQAAPKLEVVAYVKQVHKLVADVDPARVTASEVEGNIVRWPIAGGAAQVIRLIEQVRAAGDSVGGVIECVIRNAPAGLGEPVFDRMEADFGKAMLGIPASKGFEIGSGFGAAAMQGSAHNDEFYLAKGRVRTRANRSGGVQGGITNGEDIIFRVAFKPTATLMLAQKTVTVSGRPATLTARGRHDPCVLPRAVPVVEAMAWLVLADHWLRQKAISGSASV
ncbi:MAG: chorismate synthase [Verrucomicrobiales bacterium]|jgi:chorismate synthase|nr:chorismate synthase [Verrucomicrobiales bacterium]